MFCQNCGKEIGDSDKFCEYCGVKLKDLDVSDNLSNNQKKEIDYSNINVQYSSHKKSQWIAYLLLILFGTTGSHRFYSGNYIYCFIILITAILGIFNEEIWILLITFCVVDLFILHLSISHYNYKLLENLKKSQTENTFIDISSPGCLPVAAYSIVTGIIFWSITITKIIADIAGK